MKLIWCHGYNNNNHKNRNNPHADCISEVIVERKRGGHEVSANQDESQIVQSEKEKDSVYQSKNKLAKSGKLNYIIVPL